MDYGAHPYTLEHLVNFKRTAAVLEFQCLGRERAPPSLRATKEERIQMRRALHDIDAILEDTRARRERALVQDDCHRSTPSYFCVALSGPSSAAPCR